MTRAADLPARLTVRERRVAAVVAVGGLLAVLDATIVAVALPRFIATFDASLPQVQWVVTAYTLGMVAAMPLAATLAGRFGARRAYLVALLVFAGASAAAGLVDGLGWLVAARAVQGTAGGLVNPLGMTIGAGAVASEKRGRMMTITGLPLLVGPILGPLLGGVLLDAMSWRALFFVVVVPALLAAAGVLRWVPAGPAGVRDRVDVVGGLLLVPGVVAVTYGLSVDAPAPVRLGTAAAGALLVAAFVARSWRHPAPLLDVRLLRDPTFARNAAVLALYSAPYFGSALLLPVYVQVVRGDSALTSGTLVLPFAVGMGLCIQVAGRVLDRAGARVVVGTGLALAIAAGGAVALVLRPDTPYLLLGALGAVQGVGTGAVMLPTITSAVRELHGPELASGSAILPMVSSIASALGTAAVSALFAALTVLTSGGLTLGTAGADDVVTAYRITVAATLAVMALALAVRLRPGRRAP